MAARIDIANPGDGTNWRVGPAIADALHVWSASRYNDGTPATSVTLEPLDGIILQREGGLPPGCP